MTSALPPGGRRDNGLPSAEWAALVDLDPRLSEALLESLAAEGVAAYVEPASDIDGYTRATTLPKRPLDRLWVDPARADLARGVVTSEVADLTALLAEEEPGATAHGLVRPVPRTAAARVLLPPDLPTPGPTSAEAARTTDDELFQQIVAGYERPSTDPVPRWPVSEDVGEAPPDDRDQGRQPRRSESPYGGEALPGWLEPAALADESHFEPPSPPKIPRPRLRTVLGATLLLLGFTTLFAPNQIGLDDSAIYVVLGLLLTGGGAGLLVASMRDAPPTGSGSDDGAVV